MKIVVIGLGMVATSDALLLARDHDVALCGPMPERVAEINAGQYPLNDPLLPGYVADNRLRLRATCDTAQALDGADMVLVAVPLPIDPQTGAARTAEAERSVELAHLLCPDVPVVIRSAVPIGFTDRMRAALGADNILYAPEFLREGHALQDALTPRFRIIGERGELGSRVGALFADAALARDVPTRLMGAAEAEAVKHFAQAYQAARVAYFNELDSYALSHDLNARQVIDGVCLDPRIGTYANNPCFGFGGNRLARSTGHLGSLADGLSAQVLPTVARANGARIALLASKVLERGARHIGLYSPEGAPADHSPIAELRARLAAEGVSVHEFTGGDLEGFKQECDLVLAQRLTPELFDIRAKVFSRDLYAALPATSG